MPAAAVIRRCKTLSGFTGRKGRAGGLKSHQLKSMAQLWDVGETVNLEVSRGEWNYRCSGGMRRYR